MNTLIKELIEKYKKNSRLNVADQKMYVDTLFDELSKGTYDENIETILVEGPADLSMKAFALYLTSIEAGDANEFLRKFVNCDRIQENKGGLSGVRMVILLAVLIECSKTQGKMMEFVFTSMVFFAYKKDKGGINKKVIEQIRNSLFVLFDNKESIIDLQFIEKEKVWTSTRDLFIEAMMNLEKNSFPKIQKVYYWLKASGRNMGKYTEEYITKVTIEQTEKAREHVEKKHDEVVPAKDNNKSMLPTANKEHQKVSEVTTVQDTTSEESKEDEGKKADTNNADEKTSNENLKKDIDSKEKTKEAKGVLDEDTKKLIQSLTEVVISEAKEMSSINAEMSFMKRQVDEMQKQLNRSLNIQSRQEESISDLSAARQSLQKQNNELLENVAKLEEIVAKQKMEIDDRKQFTDTIARNREKQSEEQLNKLASKLRVDYRDFCDAKDIEMTIDLGENMREQLAAVFTILEKGGIKLR